MINQYIFFITDTDTNYCMFMYPITDMQNRYLFTVIKYIKYTLYSIKSSNYNNKNILFIKSIISNTDINNKQIMFSDGENKGQKSYQLHFKLQF